MKRKAPVDDFSDDDVECKKRSISTNMFFQPIPIRWNRRTLQISSSPPASPTDEIELNDIYDDDRTISPSSLIDDDLDDAAEIYETRDPRYRDKVLEPHGILIDTLGLDTPTTVHDLATGIIRRYRHLSNPNPSRLEEIRTALAKMSGHETTPFHHFSFFPNIHDYSLRTSRHISPWSALCLAENVSLDTTALPHNQTCPAPIIPPSPSLIYGFSKASFTPEEHQTMQTPRLRHCAAPSKDTFWPFLTIETHPPRQDPRPYVNQTAASGALCVNATHRLLDPPQPPSAENGNLRVMERTISFSCVLSPEEATIYVHWRRQRRRESGYGDGCYDDDDDDALTDGRGPLFYCAAVDRFGFRETRHIARFQAALGNIMDWAVGERLPFIYDALGRVGEVLR